MSVMRASTWLPLFLSVSMSFGAVVRIETQGSRYQLTRDGKPYFILGAGGSQHLDLLKQSGGNSFRTWSVPTKDELEFAEKNGLTILAGLPMSKPRQGFSYSDSQALKGQRELIKKTVLELKSSPAILMWAIGNETELMAKDADRIAIWKELEQLVKLVHSLDPSRPVITAIAGVGKSNLSELAQYTPSLDAVGINSYGAMLQLPEALEQQKWAKPWLITEFGPRGHWEVDKTPWGLPIEDSSAKKAAFYEKAYRHAIQDQPHCLGSYVFLWGQKQEKTPTWYGLFLPDGTPLNPVDTMTRMWTGKEPANHAPVISALRAKAPGTQGEGWLQSGNRAPLMVEAEVSDPDQEPVRLVWEVRKDVSDNPSHGGDFEEGAPPIPGTVGESHGNSATIILPPDPGNYRLFVYAYDGKGKASTMNLCLRVE